MPTTGSSRREDSDGNELAVFPGRNLSNEEARNGVYQESQREEHGSLNEISPDGSARLWEDLKTETGYASYAAYLEAYEERHPDLKWLKKQVQGYNWTGSRKWYPTCVIFNLSDGIQSRTRMSLHCSNSSASVILSALRQPPDTAAARIVLCEASQLDGEMVNALGLGLRIQPGFFQAYFSRYESLQPPEDPVAQVDNRRLAPEHVIIGQYVVTIARHYLPANADATPVILILGNVRDPFSIGKRFDEVKPFQNPAVGRISNAMEKLPTWMQEYVRVLQSDLEKGRGSKENITDLSFRSLAPLLRWSTFRTREK